MQSLKSMVLTLIFALLMPQQISAAEPTTVLITKPSDPCADADAIANLNKSDDAKIEKQMLKSGKKDVQYSSIRNSQYKQFLLTWITPFGYHLEYDKSGNYSLIIHAWNISQPKTDLVIDVGVSQLTLRFIRQYTGFRKDSARSASTIYYYTYSDSYNVYALDKKVVDAIAKLPAASYLKSVSQFPVINHTLVPSGSCPLYIYPREFQILRKLVSAKPN